MQHAFKDCLYMVKCSKEDAAQSSHRIRTANSDLTASLNIPERAIMAAKDGANAFNRAYYFFFFYICFTPFASQ